MQKWEYEGCDKPEKFTHFEELQKRVEVLQGIVNEISEILRQNDLIRTDKIQAPYFDDDKVYRELEEEHED